MVVSFILRIFADFPVCMTSTMWQDQKGSFPNGDSRPIIIGGESFGVVRL